jgi:hydrogenase-4 component F
MIYLLILVPCMMAGLALAVPSNRWRPWLLPIGALVHLGLVASAVFHSGEILSGWSGWLRLDALAMVILSFLSLLFFLCSLYAPGYLRLRHDRPNRVFCANLFALQATMTLTSLSQHLGLMWVAMEAITLASAPLLYFNRNGRSLEATWKYLLIGSVGIAMALFGSFFLAYSSLRVGLPSTLLFDQLIRDASKLSPPWLHGAFVLLFIGYGTKMGLAPMHTWKPDAYGEAPGIVGTLLAGGVTSCAFLALLRVYRICQASSEANFARHVMIGMGLFSMAVAAVFMVRQRDFKRMLAYSSVEHMGILVLGIGIGGVALYGALLHLITNGLTKGVLFLSAGNIHRAYGSKITDRVQGAIHRVPLSAALFLAGFLAITGSPPFGPFVSQFAILNGAMSSGQYLTAGVFLVLLGLVFVAMGTTVLTVVQGGMKYESGMMRDENASESALDSAFIPHPSSFETRSRFQDNFFTGAPILLMMALVLLTGTYLPPPVIALLQGAAGSLEVQP